MQVAKIGSDRRFGGKNCYSALAQSVEHSAVNRSVVGSSPTSGATSQYCAISGALRLRVKPRLKRRLLLFRENLILAISASAEEK